MRWQAIAVLTLVVVAAVLTACRTTAEPKGAASGTPEGARVRIRTVLARPEYRWEPEGETAVAAIARRAGEAIAGFVERLRKRIQREEPEAMPSGGGEWSFWLVFLALCVALVLGLIALVAYIVRERRGGAPRATGPRTIAVPDAEDPTACDPGDWLSIARRAAAAGDHRAAYRAAFLALLVALDRRGAIRWHRARTNGDYLRDLGESPDLHRMVRPLATRFDAVWYGSAGASVADIERCLDAATACGAGRPAGATDA